MTHPPDRPRVALIAGPTASGKSDLALEMAERENGTIINADASQIYRDLRILTARPSGPDEARVPHLLYGHVDGAIAGSAAMWAEEARAAIAATVGAGRLPILVGGTGLYLRTLIDGIAPVPPIDPAVRAEVRGLDSRVAHAALVREDADAAARLHPNDTARLQRALETVRSTGRSIACWRAERVGGIAGCYTLAATVLHPPATALADACDARVDAMVAAGALDEVRRLMARELDEGLPIMRAIGVRELAGVLKGEVTICSAIEAMKIATRQYTKRQRTWLRNQRFNAAIEYNGRIIDS